MLSANENLFCSITPQQIIQSFARFKGQLDLFPHPLGKLIVAGAVSAWNG